MLHPFASLLVSNGGDLVVDGKPTLDTQGGQRTFELYEKLIKSGYSDPAMATADANTTGPFLDNFVSGKTGMIIMANWWEIGAEGRHDRQIRRRRDRSDPSRPVGDRAALDLVFLDDGRQRQGLAGEQSAAWDFLDWLNGPGSGRTALRPWATS